MSLELGLLVVAGAVVLFLGILFVYAIVSPGGRVGIAPPAAARLGRSCVYCRSTQTRRIGPRTPRYDDHGFVLVTSYECTRCGLPFWSIDRSPAQQRSH